MEAPEFVTLDGYTAAGTPNQTPEKLWRSGGGEQFVVEDLLDFSNEEEDEAEALAEGSSGDAAGNTTDSSTLTAVDSCSNSYSDQNSGDLVGISADLCEPYDQLAELEWLSNFVEESFSSEGLENLQLISGIRPSSSSSSATRGDISAAAAAGDACPPFRAEAAIPGKIRSKRSRAATPWSSSALLPSGATSEEVPSPESGVVVPSKAAAAAEGRRCLHCATDKTPQWRTGPMGPKTLCNACGVRYKSGRLVPEYRPASSPTFVVARHSNSHRKVLELRRQKEMQTPQQQFLPPAIAGGYGGGEGFLIDRHAGLDFRRFN